jgi:hypothetical protein
MAHQENNRARGIQRSPNHRTARAGLLRDNPDSSAEHRDLPSCDNIDSRGIPASSRLPLNLDQRQNARHSDDYHRRDDYHHRDEKRPLLYTEDNRFQNPNRRNCSRDNPEKSHLDSRDNIPAVKQEHDADPPPNVAPAASVRKRPRDKTPAGGNHREYERVPDSPPSPQNSPEQVPVKTSDPPSFTLNARTESTFDPSFLKTLDSPTPATDELVNSPL